jgi:kynureninase
MQARQYNGRGMSNKAVLQQSEPTLEYACRADAEDELARFRQEFYLTRGQVYLDGNSLGPLCRQAERSVLNILEEWKRLAIGGWTEGSLPWFFLAEELGRRTAPLLGADPEEVIVANSTTVNLHQLLATLFRPAGRTKILLDELAFPSDAYAVRSHLGLRGLDPSGTLLVAPCGPDGLIDEKAIEAAMTEDVALAVLPAVVYTTGQLLDMERLTATAHARAVLIGFDCSHSVGVVPHALSDWGVDFAFWCSYKYLNGGPGATAGLYLNRRHFGKTAGLAGWFSSHKERQFDMAPVLTQADGAAGLQIGTPNILSMAPLLGALEVVQEAGIDAIRSKSLAMTDYLMSLVDAHLKEHGFGIATPREAKRRGGHVALTHPEAARICKALKVVSVTPDYRPPDIVRLAPAPLYTSFVECYEAVERLRRIMEERAYEKFPAGRGLVA